MAKKQQEQTEPTGQEPEELTVEEAFAQLSHIVEEMEAPEVTLEASMQLYRQGTALLNQCKSVLDRIETEMITLTEEGEVPDGES